MPELGSLAKDFCLPDFKGKTFKLNDFENKEILVVMFLCNHCPFVKNIEKVLGELSKSYKDRSVAFVGINSNDIAAYPEDSPKNMKVMAKESRWKFPYLFDEEQKIAKDYRAACTPDFFVYDKERKLRYRGQFDDTRPGDKQPVTGCDFKKAIDLLLEGKRIDFKQRASVGCNIKWKKRNAPDYFKN